MSAPGRLQTADARLRELELSTDQSVNIPGLWVQAGRYDETLFSCDAGTRKNLVLPQFGHLKREWLFQHFPSVPQ